MQEEHQIESDAPGGITPPQRAGSAFEDLANISHQKGDVQMITTTRDHIERLLDSSGSLDSNFFTCAISLAVGVFLALKSGAVEKGWERTFWLGMWMLLLMALYFGFRTVQNVKQKTRLRREFLKTNAPHIAKE